jgi:hypothetical protein
MKKVILILIAVLSAGSAGAAWTFMEINAPGASSLPEIYDSGIAWRPQGDYAILAASTGLYRVEGATYVPSYQAFAGSNLQRITWSPDGSYALITGGTNIYRYDHAAIGFGALTAISAADIQGSGTYTITFYDIVFNPVNPSDPPYISTNRQLSTSNKQLILYRYNPAASPKVYWDTSGGQSAVANSGFMSFSPVSMVFETHGDFILIANRYGLNSQGFYVYDPDQSTFPTTGGLMQYFDCANGNSNTVCMNPNPLYMGDPFVLIKGNGTVDRYVSYVGSIPRSFVEVDTGSGWYTSITTSGDSSYSWDGARAVFLERQEWSPNHKFMTFNGSGDFVAFVDVLGITNRMVRLYAAAWRPGSNSGLMAGQDGWIIKFSTDEVGTPSPTPTATGTPTQTGTATQTPLSTSTPVSTITPTQTPIPTETVTPPSTNTPELPPTNTPTQGPTSTPAPIPAMSPPGISILLLGIGLLLGLTRSKIRK